jgi:hypothetical protein
LCAKSKIRAPAARARANGFAALARIYGISIKEVSRRKTKTPASLPGFCIS